MDVLLSWSKNQSREAARAFHAWLPKVLPVKPWHSTFDIEKGKRWFDQLRKRLDTARACLVFITAENVDSKWIYWETGAVSSVKADEKNDTKEPIIIPILVNVDAAAIADGPLEQYQAGTATKDDILLAVEALNELLDVPLNNDELRGRLEKHWNELDQQLERIKEMGMPQAVVDVVKGINEMNIKFGKEWTAARNADGYELGKLLLSDICAKLKALVETNKALPDRERICCNDLYKKVYKANDTNYQATRNERGDTLDEQFRRTIDEIKSAYE